MNPFQAPTSNPEAPRDPLSEMLGIEAGDTSAFQPRTVPFGPKGIPVEPEGAPSDPFQPQQPQQPQQVEQPQQQPQQPQPDPELERLRREVATLKAATPIQEYLNSDPALAAEVYGSIEKRLRGPESIEQQPTPIPAPQEPVRPGDFSQDLAFTDPSSSSWRYREEVEQYRVAAAVHKAEVAEAKALAVQQRLERIEQGQKQNVQDRQNYQFAISKGATAEQAQDYVNFLNQPNVTPESLFNLFMVTNGKPQGALPALTGSGTLPQNPQQQLDPVAQAARRLAYPTMTGAMAPPTQQQSPNDRIFDAILGVPSAAAAFK